MRYAILSAAAVMLFATGCAPNPLTNEERIELMVYMNQQLQMELLDCHRRIAELSGGEGSTQPQQAVDEFESRGMLADDPFKAVRVSLHRVTGGMNTDDKPGDEGVRVLVQPEDKNGDTVKRAGAVEIELFDLAAPQDARTVGRWQFTVDQASREWVSGLLGASGYSFELPWQNGPPAHDHLTLMVRFTTLDGRPLTAQKDLKVQLAATPAAPAGP